MIRKRGEGNDSSGKVIVRMSVGNSSPGQASLRDAQHDFERRLILLSVESKRCDEMVLVQFPHAFDGGDEFWIIFEGQPAVIDSSNWRVNSD